MLSAPAVKKAHEAIDSAKQAITELLQSREWDTREEANALHSILTQLERTSVDYIKLECTIYGFELWRYLSDNAIQAEAWKDLEQARKEAQETKRKQSTNRHYKALGLELPFPEVNEQ